jgi:ABC-type microcin C transport system permease subunit YejE
VGASGGLLILWDQSMVEVWSSVSMDHVLIIHGRFFYKVMMNSTC